MDPLTFVSHPLITDNDAVNTHDNPHDPWPIEASCCSYHFPVGS